MTDAYMLNVAKIVRSIMKMHGKHMVFVNKYYTGTRTVKCYSRGNSDVNMIQHIEAVLKTFPVKSAIYKTNGSFYGGAGLIVKLPVQ